MRPVSRKRAKLLRQYSVLRTEFLTSRPGCEFPACPRLANEIHHMAGRVGELLLATELWLPLCSEDHRFVTVNPQAAYDMGLSVRRIGRAS